jgi:hypothetical protein
MLDLVDDESRPVEEIEAELNRLKAKADAIMIKEGGN